MPSCGGLIGFVKTIVHTRDTPAYPAALQGRVPSTLTASNDRARYGRREFSLLDHTHGSWRSIMEPVNQFCWWSSYSGQQSLESVEGPVWKVAFKRWECLCGDRTATSRQEGWVLSPPLFVSPQIGATSSASVATVPGVASPGPSWVSLCSSCLWYPSLSPSTLAKM
jgi:hypothetical protein